MQDSDLRDPSLLVPKEGERLSEIRLSCLVRAWKITPFPVEQMSLCGYPQRKLEDASEHHRLSRRDKWSLI